jgi:hypothetical protein
MMITKKSGILLVFALLFAALVFTGCPMEEDDDENPALYRVLLSSPANGSLSVSPPAALAGGVAGGTSITLTPLPAPGYQLVADSLEVTNNAETVAVTPVGGGGGGVPNPTPLRGFCGHAHFEI